MKTLNQFKHENNITSIDLNQGKGRAFASVRDQKIYVSSKTDLNKPLFVSDYIRRPNPGVVVTEDTVLDDTNSVADYKSHWLVNSDMKAVATI